MTAPNQQIGPIVTGVDVEEAIVATIKKWMPTYLAEVAAQRGLDRSALPMFRSYQGRISLDRDTSDQMPACIVVAPGISNSRNSSGILSTGWSAAAAAVVSAKDEASTYNLARVYAAALRTLLMQQSDLGGFSDNLYFSGERYDEYPTSPDRTIAAGVVRFEVWVEEASYMLTGPTEPVNNPSQPLPDLPTVQTIQIDVEEKVS